MKKEAKSEQLKINTNTSFKWGAGLLCFLILFLLLGFVFGRYDSEAMDATNKLASPSLNHLFGCDQFGRDILTRVREGMLTTFLIASITVIIGSVAGVILGAITGYYGGVIDGIFMRINDVLFAFPSILMALLLLSIFGAGTSRVVLALGIAVVPSFAKMMRGEFLKQRNADYVQVAKLMGASNFRIMFVHILPNTIPVLKSCIFIAFNNAVLAEAGMSYLGIGVQPPTASLGRMLSEAQTYLKTAPWYTIFPGMIMILMILAITLLGEAEGGRQWKLSEKIQTLRTRKKENG